MNYEDIDRKIRTFTETEIALREQYLIRRDKLRGPHAQSSAFQSEEDEVNTLSPFKSTHSYLSEDRFIPEDEKLSHLVLDMV
jgi:hypothetical protein